MTEPKYGPWIAHNANKDSVCPVTRGTLGQVTRADQTLNEAEKSSPEEMTWTWNWKYDGPSRVILYRVLIEPVRDVRGGGLAFPHEAFFEGGMSLRDWFAGQALIGILSGGFADTIPHDDICGGSDAAGFAYQYADAMLAEREKGA